MKLAGARVRGRTGARTALDLVVASLTRALAACALTACAPVGGRVDSAAARDAAVAPAGKAMGPTDTTGIPSAKSDSVPARGSSSSAPITLPFRARGNEPGWSLEIGEREMTLVASYGEQKLTAATPAPTTTGDTTRWAARAGAREIDVTVVDRLCHDGMSGFPFPRTVTVRFDGKTLQGCGGESVQVLVGPAWTVRTIDGANLPEGSRPTLLFEPEGRVSGRGPCNRFSGGYTLRGEELSFTALASTRMACAEPIMQWEQRFLAAMAAVRRFELRTDGTLVLSADGSHTITARR